MLRPSCRGKGLVAGVVLAACAPQSQAQELETDYAKFLSPIVFVLPAAPDRNASTATRKYVARIDVSPDGTVQRPVTLDPAEPGMTAAVNDAAQYWVFAPGLTEDCKAGPRSGKIGFEYDAEAGRAWVELPKLEGAPATTSRFSIVNRGGDIQYPSYERKRGISGSVTVAFKLMADGSSSEQTVYFAVPRNREFMQAALSGARRIAVKFDEPLGKPYRCSLVTYTFKVE